MTLAETRARLRAILGPGLTDEAWAVLYWGEHERTLTELAETFEAMPPEKREEHVELLMSIVAYVVEKGDGDGQSTTPGADRQAAQGDSGGCG